MIYTIENLVAMNDVLDPDVLSSATATENVTIHSLAQRSQTPEHIVQQLPYLGKKLDLHEHRVFKIIVGANEYDVTLFQNIPVVINMSTSRIAEISQQLALWKALYCEYDIRKVDWHYLTQFKCDSPEDLLYDLTEITEALPFLTARSLINLVAQGDARYWQEDHSHVEIPMKLGAFVGWPETLEFWKTRYPALQVEEDLVYAPCGKTWKERYHQLYRTL